MSLDFQQSWATQVPSIFWILSPNQIGDVQTLSPVPQAAFSLHCEEQTRQQQASRPTGHWPIHEDGEWILDLCKI